MAKVCSICNTENRDDAQFCRGCGAPLNTTVIATPPPVVATPAPAPIAAAEPEEPAGYGVTCEECGFFNRAGIRFCARCGTDLFGPQNKTVVAPPMQPANPSTAAPRATAPGHRPDGPGADETFDLDRDAVSDIPDADATIAVTGQRPAAAGSQGVGFQVAPTTTRNRTPLWIGLGVAVVAAAGAALWFASSTPTPVPYPDPAASAVVFVPPSVASAPASAPASSPFSTLGDASAASAATGASAVDPNASGGAAVVSSVGGASAPSSMSAASTPAVATFPPAAASSPSAGATTGPATPSSPFDTLSKNSGKPASAAGTAVVDPAAKAAAEKRTRERLAREKADREAKAKLLADQREQAAAKLKAEQEAKRKADELARGRGAVPPPPTNTPQTAPGPKTVREICSDRNIFTRGVCEAQQCMSASHANESVCRQLKEAQERRQNYNN